MARRLVCKVTLEGAGPGIARLSVRLRGETKWLDFRHIVLSEGDNFEVHDGGSGNMAPLGIEFEEVPFEEEQPKTLSISVSDRVRTKESLG